MKPRISVFLPLFLLAMSLLVPGLGLAQQQKPQAYWIYQEVVKPSSVAKYEEATKKEFALFAEAKSPYPWTAYSTDDFYYYFLSPIENFAAMDAMNKHYEDFMKKFGDRMQALMKSSGGTYEYERQAIAILRPDLSYTPAKPRLKPEEEKFYLWAFCYVEPGKEQEFEQVCKDWAALYKSKNVRDPFYTWVGEIGLDNPVTLFVMPGKDAADYWAADAKSTRDIGEAAATALWTKTMSLLRKYEYKTGKLRPDLSYTPKTK